ncbi:MAG: hypothetical protein U1F52_15955 [Burkholderiales bacterium]
MGDSTPLADGVIATAVRALGLALPGPVGLAAGFDRTGHSLGAARQWGFGFVELGTATLASPAGETAAALANTIDLHRRRTGDGNGPIIGVNVGIGPGRAARLAWRDYAAAVASLGRCADYVVLNLTSDAAARLRSAAARPHLQAVLEAAASARCDARVPATVRRPSLLVKWPMETSATETARLLDLLVRLHFDGVIAAGHRPMDAPTWAATVPRTCRTWQEAAPSLDVIAVGGVDSADRARRLKAAGIRLVQMHRGFTAGGPRTVRDVALALVA